MTILSSVTRSVRGFFGFYAEMRRCRLLLEWLFLNGITGRLGDMSFTIDPVNLPPTKADIKAAVKERVESIPIEQDEELYASRRALELLQWRARGEVIDDDEPGADWRME